MTRKKRLTRRTAARPKYRFTKEDCRRGYQAALAKCMENWDLYAWFFRRIRRHYAKEKNP